MTQHDPNPSPRPNHESGHDPAHDPTQHAARALPGFGAAIADPGPLGLAGFAGTTLFLSAVNANMLSASVQAMVFGLAIFYGGIAQLLAGLWEFVKGNTFGATAFVSFGAFWLSFWYLLTHLPKATPVNTLHGVGLYLLVWTIFTAYMTVASLRTTGAILAVFAALTLTFLALTIGFFSESAEQFVANSNGWIHLGGYLGLVTAALAFYGSFAGVTNSTFRKTVLPVIPLAPAENTGASARN